MRRIIRKRTGRWRNGRYALFWHYLIGYIVVLFIPLFICSVYYQNMIQTISRDELRTRQSNLEHSMELVDTMLNELNYLGDSLATNAAVNQFKGVEDPYEYPKAYQVNKLQMELPQLYQINPSIFNYYIFFNHSDMVINKSIAYEYQEFYKLYMHEADSVSYEQWYYSLKNETQESGMYPVKKYWLRRRNALQSDYVDEERNFLVYNRPLMVSGGWFDNSGYIRFYIDSSYLDTLMPALSEADEGAFLIADSNKQPLYGKATGGMQEKELQEITEVSDELVTLGGDKYILIHLESEESGLNYYILYPEKSVSARKTSAILAVMTCIAAAIFIGLLLSFYMSRKSAGSVNDVLKVISKETEYYDSHLSVFSHLKSTYSKLIRENSVLSEAIDKQKPFIRNALVNRLIYGDCFSLAEMGKLTASLEIPWLNRRLCVLILRFHAGQSDLLDQNTSWIDSCVISLLEILDQKTPDSLYINVGEGRVVLILNEEECEESQFREKTERLIGEIREELPASIAERMFVYGGNQITQFSDIHQSYNQAVSMFRRDKEQFGGEVVWFSDNSDSLPLYPPAEMEMRLTHLVTSGDEKGLHDELGSLLNVYIIKNTLPLYLQQMFLSELQIIMFRILPAIDMEKEECQEYYRQLEENHNSPLLEQIMKTVHIYGSVCQYVKKKQEGLDAGKIIPSVVAYIEMNYGNNNLSLASVAEAFGLGESHLSTVFKQMMGMNFSSYMEGIRIDKAKELLEQSNVKIGEIAEQVGYYSVNSFCRAFKRVTGSSATEYRSGIKK